jgi:peptidoglycan-associated lipoprotein
VIFFFIFISCATEAIKEEEKVTPTDVAETKEAKEETKTAEESTAETKVPTAPKEETTPTTTTTEEKTTTTVTKEQGETKVTKMKEMTSAERRLQSDERAFTSTDIYFDFDKYNLTPKAREILADKAYWLKKNPSVKVYIEGHCDERGTNEYNLALGERRANSSKTYLTSLGISPGRLGIISYGEERPVDPSRNEMAWAKNRRAHFVITSR